MITVTDGEGVKNAKGPQILPKHRRLWKRAGTTPGANASYRCVAVAAWIQDPNTPGDRPSAVRRFVMFKTSPEFQPARSQGVAPSPCAQVEGAGGQLPALTEIGFVGLGRMGIAMAANLASAGYRVIAYVRRQEQLDKLEVLGLYPTLDITRLFGCAIVISMLPDDDAVRDVVFGREELGIEGLSSGLLPGAIHLSMSTISTVAASHFASEHARRRQGYVAAPVFGNPDAAIAHQLYVVAAGMPSDIERCRPLLGSIGQRLFTVGTEPAAANLVKLLGNMMTATTLEMLGEVIALFRKRELDPKPFVDILTNTMFGGRAHTIYGDKMVRQSYAAGFVMPLALKDVRLALAEAKNSGVSMPSVEVVRDRLIEGVARGYGDLDWTALGLIAAQEAGLQVEAPEGA
jgi:3-hydroxyisobutyrate dehydrogenase-like beta-hydroxyacid dehydrogenase